VTSSRPKPDPPELLRRVGLRVTGPRLASLAEHPHAGADTVLAAVRAGGNVSTQAGYDVLNTLTEHRLLRRIQPAGWSLATSGPAPRLEPDNDSGFVIDGAEVTWWGICPACQHSLADNPTATTQQPTTEQE
jgi:Fe2+ or Zn2+ uptake regulation protein